MTSLRSGVKLTLMKTVLNSISRTFDFKGRSSIKELVFYILFLVIQFLIFFVFNQIKVGTILPIIEAMYGWTNILRYIEVVLGGILLLSFIPLICLVIRRLHDINLSGLYIVVPAVILSLIHFFINGLNQNSESESYYDIKKMEYVDASIMNINSTLVIIITIIVLMFLCLKDSSDGDNKYGKHTSEYIRRYK